jgi:hypothetical protein
MKLVLVKYKIFLCILAFMATYAIFPKIVLAIILYHPIQINKFSIK